MSLTSGSRLGAYEIVASIGAGGMGEVYRARDTKLGRSVAVKIVREGLADADRVARLRELARGRVAPVAAGADAHLAAALHGRADRDDRVTRLPRGSLLPLLASNAQ